MQKRHSPRKAHMSRYSQGQTAKKQKDGVSSELNRRTKQPSRRPGVVFIGLCLSALAFLLIGQLYQIQIVDHAVNAEKAAEQHYKKVAEEPRRGMIYDCNNVVLAGTTYVHRIGITPKDVYSVSHDLKPEDIALAIAQFLKLPLKDVQAAMQEKEALYIQLKKDVPREEAKPLADYMSEFGIGGIRIDTEAKRYYTNGSLASQVIGFCRYDENRLVGQLGIEWQYNDLLTGQPGYTYVETDNYGNKGELPFSIPTSLRAENGQNIILNLDINIQKILQEELDRAIRLYDIKDGGEAIVVEPFTGAILGMASWPYFESSAPASQSVLDTENSSISETSESETSEEEWINYLSSSVWRNRTISNTFEPGSTMKSITAAIGFEENLIHEKATVVCKPINLYQWTIYCANRAGHGEERFEMGFWRSCNPVFAQLALNTGVDRFYRYIHAFGLMDKTGIDLPGEGTGLIHQQPTELDMATFSYGESSTVTPLQLVMAYCAFANGGKLVRPTVVKAITDADGHTIQERKPETVRQVISEQTALRVREMMKGVVLYGTGSSAYVEGYSVAGKTSTSTSDDHEHTLSFAGIAPAENPELVVLVVLHKPEDPDLTSKAAAKTCGQIISRSLEYMGIERVYSDSDISRLTAKISVPDVCGLAFSEALKTLEHVGLDAKAGDPGMGDATLVQYQWPEKGTELHEQGLVVLYPVEEPEEETVAIPDFRGRTVQECFTLARDNSLNVIISDDCLGLAVSQDPSPENLPADPDQEPEQADGQGTGAPDDDDVIQGQDNIEDQDQDEVAAVLKPGDSVTITFEVVEEELAHSDQAE